MVTRRELLAGMLVASVAVVGAAVFARRTRAPAPVVSKSDKPTILGAMHFPTTLESPAFSDAKIDDLFTDMLAAMGVQMVAFEWDYQVFSDSRWNDRLVSAYDHARAKGMKTHIINQMQPSFWSAGGINPPPASATSGSVDSYEAEIVSAYAQLGPDYLSILAEPTNLQKKFNLSYSSSRWNSLVQKLVNLVPTDGPSLWVDLVATSGPDMALIPSLVGISGLDGIGMDLYGRSGESAVGAHLPAIARAGKLWGLTETWWGPLYANPSLNTAQNAAQMASYFSPSYAWAAKNGSVMYNPFFTNLFVQEPQKVSYNYAGLTAYFSEELTRLEKRSYTDIHDAYAKLIASSG